MAKIIKGKNPNKPWTARVWVDGRQRERSFRTKREAADFVARVEHERREGFYRDPRAAAEPFAAAAERWIAARRAPRSRDTYTTVFRRHVGPATSGRTLRAVAADRVGVTRLLAQMDTGPSMRQTAYALILGTVREAERAGLIAGHRLAGIRLDPRPRRREFAMPARAEVDALAAAMPGGLRLSVYLMRYSGLRVGEALALRASDVHDGWAHVVRQRHPDGTVGPLKARAEGQGRDVPMPAFVAAMVAAQEREGDDLFRPLSRSAYERRFRDAAKAAGLDVTPHALRHAFGQDLLEAGIEIVEVARWLGHRSVETTFRVYSWPSTTGIARANAAMSG